MGESRNTGIQIVESSNVIISDDSLFILLTLPPMGYLILGLPCGGLRGPPKKLRRESFLPHVAI